MLWWQYLDPSSTLSQKAQTILVKPCWRRPGLLSLEVSCLFQALVQGIPCSSPKLGDPGCGGRQVTLHGTSPGSAGPALSQDPICLTIPECHLWKSEFKASLGKPSISSCAIRFHKTFQCHKAPHPLCIAFSQLSGWPYAAAQPEAGAVTGPLCPRWMIRAGTATLNERE